MEPSLPKQLNSKVPYINISGRHRPYLEIILENGKVVNKTFALIDSGADHTVIPYSLGVKLGLEGPRKNEMLNIVNGVGSSINYLERNCSIYLPIKSGNVVHKFNETVWWIYPDEPTQKYQEELRKEIQNYINLKDQTKEDTELCAYFEAKISESITNLNKLNNTFETDVLIGRPFFDNFEYIQFFHKDRHDEEKCYFKYKVSPEKIAQTIKANDEERQRLEAELNILNLTV